MSDVFGIYIHWPYCAAKCPYCDFNSHVRQSIDHDAWRIFYVRELEYYASLTAGRTVNSVFFGGGTPSLMEPETAAVVLEAIHRLWPVESGVEITLEANPTSIEIEKFSAFRSAGINRVSVGVQSLLNDQLEFLGREHTAEEALKAFDVARRVFDRYSFDLIYARPGQTAVMWEEELRTALAHAGDHMSLYQLTIEKGTPFYTRHKRGEFFVPEQDLAGELYEMTQEIMNDAGLPAYEISNHARPGEESRHNLVYWRYGDYIGIGPGAHGRLTLKKEKVGTRGHRAPEIWMKNVEQQGYGSHDFEKIGQAQCFTEALMMGMRLREGVDLATLAQAAGGAWQDYIYSDNLERLIDEGYVILEGERLRPTLAGMQRLNAVLDYIIK